MRIIGGYQDTRLNKEDFAITPYIFSVYVNGSTIKVFGFGLCWGFYSAYIALGLNIPKEIPSFITIK